MSATPDPSTARDCPASDCARPTNPHHQLCDQHAWVLQRALAEIPALAAQLDVTLAKQRGASTGGGGGVEQPLPFDTRSSAAGWVLRNTLTAWIRHLEHDHTRHPRPALPEQARWLLARHHDLIGHPDAGDLVDEITSAVTEAWRVVDIPPTRVYAGVCRHHGCTEPLWAYPGRATVTCPTCGTEHDVEDCRDAMRNDLDGMLLTARQIATAAAWLGVLPDTSRTENRISVWASRKRITPHGVDRNGRPTYPFGDTLSRLLVHIVGT